MIKDLTISGVLEIPGGRYFAKIALKKLKEFVNSGHINIDLSEDVPYVPLEPNAEITLGINTQKSSLSYNKDKKELIVGELDVVDGRIKLITFIKEQKDNFIDGKIDLHIISYNTEDIPHSFK